MADRLRDVEDHQQHTGEEDDAAEEAQHVVDANRRDGFDERVGEAPVGVDGAPLAGTLSFLPKPVRRVVLADDPYYSEVNARYIQIDFDDLTNADGYIEVAYVYAGIVVELEKSMAYGWQLWRQEQARTKRAANGQIWVDSLYKRFHASCLFDFQSDKRAGGFWKYFFTHVGVSKEFGVSLKDGTAASKAWTTLYCKLAQPVPVGWVDYDSHEVPVEFVEIP